MSEAVSSEVRSVLIPLESERLLLPNAAVAEVVGYRKPEPQANLPDWLLGFIEWRQYDIPVVSFDGLLDKSIQAPGHRGRIIVTHTLNGDEELPYIGLVAQAIPRLVRVTSDNILPASTDEEMGVVIQKPVIVGGESALIPDLDELELLVQDALAQM
ncbi:MAG: chemotaxis protein CheW [gamma proteobacterium endosymbiont of Lamellibrachia anaximandri]|nr:chemotaxis protein CheW [gamma proteobacterium endosymbiont of Lamellibrachia anaximandri]MBL3535394.1 chemotaxis protein CheW [gamma proteobacterium endosymbiont of Lamellibrachia anaximandri]MBL3599889.1 chemotaxis protein CheW [gamma proteobacterium endosymbiont of Lamellibrachia anaximandri]